MPKINREIVRFFAALADETRLKILTTLMSEGKSVGEIHKNVGLTLSAISHQLKYLSSLDIIDYHKKGREKVFHLSDKFCWCILEDAFKHFR